MKQLKLCKVELRKSSVLHGMIYVIDNTDVLGGLEDLHLRIMKSAKRENFNCDVIGLMTSYIFLELDQSIKSYISIESSNQAKFNCVMYKLTKNTCEKLLSYLF